MTTVYLNGAFVPASEAKISPMDRGFLFGDGIYEVIPSYAGRFVGFGPHIDRMHSGPAPIVALGDATMPPVDPDPEGRAKAALIAHLEKALADAHAQIESSAASNESLITREALTQVRSLLALQISLGCLGCFRNAAQCVLPRLRQSLAACDYAPTSHS